jgi:hypothetical protein
MWFKVYQLLTTGQWFSPGTQKENQDVCKLTLFTLFSLIRSIQYVFGTPVSSTNKSDRHDITEIVLNVALNTIL